MPLLTHTTPAPKRIALSCEFTKDQKAAEERLGSAKMYEDVDLRGIPLLEFPASLLEQPTGAGVAQFDAATLGSMLAADRDAALRGELRSYLSQQKDARHKALASMTAADVDELVEGVQAACSSKKGAELAARVRNVASGDSAALKLRRALRVEVPPMTTIARLVTLRSLVLSENGLRELLDGEWLTALDLELLDLNENTLSSLPPALVQLRSLRVLRLADNAFAELDGSADVIFALAALEELVLSGNRLTSVPPHVGRLQRLKRLDLRGNQLAALPDEVGELSALEVLDIFDNKLTALPDALARLGPTLKRLEAASNQLESKGVAALTALTALEELDVFDNVLTELPPLRCVGLRKRAVGGNMIFALDDSVIGELVDLEELRASRAALTVVPPPVERLLKLRTLWLDHNAITILPGWLSDHPAMSELRLDGNPLADATYRRRSGDGGIPAALHAHLAAHVIGKDVAPEATARRRRQVDLSMKGTRKAAASALRAVGGSFRRRGNAAGHARFDGDESDGDSFRRSSEVQEQKLGGGGRSSFFRRSSEVREVGRSSAGRDGGVAGCGSAGLTDLSYKVCASLRLYLLQVGGGARQVVVADRIGRLLARQPRLLRARLLHRRLRVLGVHAFHLVHVLTADRPSAGRAARRARSCNGSIGSTACARRGAAPTARRARARRAP